MFCLVQSDNPQKMEDIVGSSLQFCYKSTTVLSLIHYFDQSGIHKTFVNLISVFLFS